MSQYSEIVKKIRSADAILIGASNGLSITEGLHLFANNKAFSDVFGDFQKKYGLRNILEGFYYRWPSQEEQWAFFSRLVNHYSGHYTGSGVMDDLKYIIGEKPYFIVTSNGEYHFELAGFEAGKVYEVEGNWLNMRCSTHCHDTLYSTMDMMKNMAEKQQDCKIPSELMPYCPKCGAAMRMYDAQPPKKEIKDSWDQFLKDYHGKNLVILELGIGWRNQLIKAPLMRLTAEEPNVTYITINLGEIYITDNIKHKSYGLDGVLQKAMEVFWQQGYEKTSMSDLVEHMGIHRKSIYDTFGDKHALYLRVIDCYDEFSTAKFKSETLKAKTSYQAIQYIFDYIIEGNEGKHYGCLFVNATTEFGPSDQEVLEKTENAFRYAEKFIAEIIKKGQEDGEFSPKYENELLAEVLHNALLGLRVLVKTSASKEKMHNIANFFLDLLCK